MSRAKTSRRQAVQPAEPLRLWAIEWLKAPANWVALPSRLVRANDEDTAWKHVERELANLEQRMPDRADYRVLPVLAPAPERTTPWGEGQFDHVHVGPGVTIALRITSDGRVKMLSPGGEIDVTDGSSSLGTGLHEAGRRAAQVRVRRDELARRRAERKVGGEGARVAHLPRRNRR